MDNLKDSIDGESVDFRELLTKFVNYWYWFVVCIIGCLGAAFAINHFSSPIYEVSSQVLVQQEKSLLDEKFTASLGLMNTNFQLFNEMGILKSYSLTRRAIERLNFRFAYFQVKRFSSVELYKDSPFIVVPDSSGISLPSGIPFFIEVISPTQFTVEAQGKNVPLCNIKTGRITGLCDNINIIKAKGTILKPFIENKIRFTIIPANSRNLGDFVGKRFSFEVHDNNTLIGNFRQFKVQDSKNSSLINITIQGRNVSKQVDFLNMLMRVYLERGLEKKNQIADNTIRFINDQLGDVADSLSLSEERLQDYRSNQSMMDVSFQSQQVFTTFEKLKDQRAELLVKNKYFEYLLKYLSEDNDGTDIVLPSSLGIDDAILNSLVTEMLGLYNERAEMVVNSKRDNPFLLLNEQKITRLRKSALENIKNLLNVSKISLQDVDRRIEDMSGKVNKLPETQRKMFGYERKFKLNDAIYTYLLTKRSEVQISKASYLPDNEIVDDATMQEYSQVSPNKRQNYIIGLIFGFGIPILILMLRDYFNNKIQTNEDIEAITESPILGHVIHNKEKSKTIVIDSPMSLVSESIRGIRANFQFVASEREKHVILVTSSGMGEGKTFVSLNIALSLALYKKKVILLNFDLRKPKLHEYLKLETGIGLSGLLSGNANIDDAITKTVYENLDVMMAGVIPPNPMELIANERTNALFAELKKRYDYILVDTPPVGMVADALLLLKHSDVNLFMVRQNVTNKKVFAQIMKNFVKRDVKNVNIILNDIRSNNWYHTYNYGYNYNYSYAYKV
jgi:tyrosine-protein kinase Etk/Wzc